MPRAGDQFPQRRGADDLRWPTRGLLDYTQPLNDTAKQAGDRIVGQIGAAATQGGQQASNETVTTLLQQLGIGLVIGDTATNQLGDFLGQLLTPNSALNASNLWGLLPHGTLPAVPATAVSAAPSNPLWNPYFEGAVALASIDGWSWDSTTYWPAPGPAPAYPVGSARITADGNAHWLNSNPFAVNAGQTVAFDVPVLATALAAAGTPIQLAVVSYLDDVQVAVTTLESIGAPAGITTGWVAPPTSSFGGVLAASYTAPSDHSVNKLVMRLIVGAGATAGTIRFGAVGVTITGGVIDTISTNINTHLDNTVAELLGIPVTTQQTTSDAATALGSIFNSIISLSASMQSFLVQQGGAAQYGQGYTVRFADYPDGPFSATPFAVTYSGAGSGHLVISNGQASWVGVSDGDVSALGRYTGGPTNTDYQQLLATIAGLPNGTNSHNYARVRVNAADDTYVYAGIYLNSSFQLCWELGCYVAGVKTVFDSGTNAPMNVGFVLRAGVGTNPYRFQGVSGSQIVFDYTDAAHVSQLGASYREWGWRSDTAGGGAATPAPASFVGCFDNAPPVTQGSGFRMSCSSTTPQSISAATNTSPPGGSPAWAYFPNGFFDTTDNITPDMTPSTYSGHDAITIGTEGWYLFELRCQQNASSGSGVVSIYAGYLKNGVFEQLANGPSVAVNVLGTQWAPTALGGNCPIYCVPGDKIVPIIYVDATVVTSFLSALNIFGDPNNRLTYWSLTRVFGR